jgi:hypothetical protein
MPVDARRGVADIPYGGCIHYYRERLILEIILIIVAIAIGIFLLVIAIKLFIFLIKLLINGLKTVVNFIVEHKKPVLIISGSLIFFCATSWVVLFLCFQEVVINDTRYLTRGDKIGNIIADIQEKMIHNIETGVDINDGIDADKTSRTMANHERRLQSSSLLEFTTKPFSVRIVPASARFVMAKDRAYYDIDRSALSECLANVRINGDRIKREKISQLLTEYMDLRLWDLGIDYPGSTFFEKRETIDYEIIDLLAYYSYQSELSADIFLYLLEMFSLKDCKNEELAGVDKYTVDVSPLPVTVTNIDGIMYDSIAVEFLQSRMREKSKDLKNDLARELTESINSKFALCVYNVDAYLDWYYGAFNNLLAQPVITIIAAINPKKTVRDAIQEYTVKNYVEKIGNGVNFQSLIGILERHRNKMFDYALLYTTALEVCVFDYIFYTETTRDITGDDYMASFSDIPDYLNKVISEGLPIIGMGDTLDTDGIFVIDALSTVLNFLPGVGFIAGSVVDYIALKGTEAFKRPEFREQIIFSIRMNQHDLLNVVRVEQSEEAEL